MRYPDFRRQHLFVGSGVIEAGCKTVIGSRFKQSGMFWTVRGANAIIALRCCHLNGRFEDYWEARRPLDFHFYVAHPRRNICWRRLRPSFAIRATPPSGRSSKCPLSIASTRA